MKTIEEQTNDLLYEIRVLKNQKVALVKENMKLKSIICDLEDELGKLKESKVGDE